MPFTEPTRHTLSNGLTVLTAPRPASPAVAVLVIYRAGSLYEPRGCTGLAHLTEHMMFRGTALHPEGTLDEITNSLGGVNNAMTTSDYAAYYFVLPPENWPVALSLEADRMSSCLMDDVAFETERNVAMEERRMLYDDPESVLDEAIQTLAYQRHPYRFPVIGLLSDLETVTVEDLRAFYADRYAPGNAVLVVAGDVEPGEAEDAAEDAFGGIHGPSAADREVPAEPPQVSPRSASLALDVSVPRLSIAFHSPRAASEDSPALEVLATLLAGGRSSRLYRLLVTEGAAATDVSASHLLQRDPGLFTLSVELSPGEDPAACEREVVAALDELRRCGVGVDELSAARRLATLETWLGHETALGAAGFLGFWELVGGWELGLAFDGRVAGVTAADVAEAAITHLDPETRTTAWAVRRA